MNKETIEKAADHHAANAKPANIYGNFDKYNIADAFEAGARYILDRLVSVPWDEAMKELAEYAEESTQAGKEDAL